jgi:hypothetical protein
MPLTVMAVFGPTTPATDAELAEALTTARGLAPDAARVEIRGLDRHYMLLTVPETTPEVRMEPDLPAERIGSIAVTIWLSDGTEVEEVAASLLVRLEQAFAPEAVAAFHASVHLDLVPAGATQPPAFTFTINRRRPEHTRDQYMWYYRTRHVPLAKSVQPRFVRYLTHRTLYERGNVFDDAITIQEYASIEEIDRHIKTRTAPSDSTINDLENFIGAVDYYIGDRLLVDSTTPTA